MELEWEEVLFSFFLLTFFFWNRATYCTSNKFDFFIPTSLIAIIVNVKNKNVNLKLGLIIAVYGILGAIVGANVSMHLDMKKFKKVFWDFFTSC